MRTRRDTSTTTSQSRVSQSKETREVQASSLEELTAAKREICDLRQKITEQYLPEMQRLREIISRNQFERNAQFALRKAMTYADQVKHLKLQIVALESRLAEAERLREEWFKPEIERLNETLGIFEKTKHEWWDPQLELREARIVFLEGQLKDALERLSPKVVGTTSAKKPRIFSFSRK